MEPEQGGFGIGRCYCRSVTADPLLPIRYCPKTAPTFGDVLADLRRRATSMRDLGTRLEVLTKQFLQPKLYGNRFPNVWVWFSVMFPIIPQSVTTRAYPEAVC